MFSEQTREQSVLPPCKHPRGCLDTTCTASTPPSRTCAADRATQALSSGITFPRFPIHCPYVPAHKDFLSKQHFPLLFNYKNNVGYYRGCPLQQPMLHPGVILYYSPQCPRPGLQRLFQMWLSFYARIASINVICCDPYDIPNGSPDLVCFLNIANHPAFHLCILPSTDQNVPSTRHLLMFQESSLKHT